MVAEGHYCGPLRRSVIIKLIDREHRSDGHQRHFSRPSGSTKTRTFFSTACTVHDVYLQFRSMVYTVYMLATDTCVNLSDGKDGCNPCFISTVM